GSADPEEVLGVRIPRPVTADPLHVVPFGLRRGRLLGDRIGRRFRHNRSGLGLEFAYLGERLVDRAAGLHFNTGLGQFRVGRGCGGALRSKSESQGQQANRPEKTNRLNGLPLFGHGSLTAGSGRKSSLLSYAGVSFKERPSP